MNKMDARRAFGKLFLAAVALYTAQHFIAIWDLVTEGGEVIALFEYSRSTGYACWLMPVYAALPFATSFCADLNSGQLAQIRLRSGDRRYIASKMTACALAGGSVCALGMLSFWALLTLLSGAPQLPPATGFEFTYMNQVLMDGHVALLLGGLFYLEFIGGAFWALSALALSAFLPNKYYVLCFPLLLHQVYFALLGAFEIPPQMNALLLLKGTAPFSFWDTMWMAALVAGVGILVCALAFTKRMQWRFRHG